MILEGPNGAGKSSLFQALVEEATARCVFIARYQEPGGTEFGTLVRKLVKEHYKMLGAPLALQLLLKAREAIYRSMAGTAAELLLTDRGFISTIVYQGILSGQGTVATTALEHFDAMLRNHVPHDCSVIVLEVEPPADLTRREGEKDAVEESCTVGAEMEAYRMAFGISRHYPFCRRVDFLKVPFVAGDDFGPRRLAQVADAVFGTRG